MRRKLLALLTNGILIIAMALCAWLCSGVTRGERISQEALAHLGKPYVLGKSGPEQFDCSGLIVSCYRQQGIVFSHSAESIGADARARIIDDPRRLMPGDIVCFDTVADRDPSDHVGIWLGGNRFVHASSSKGEVVVSSLDGYYLEHYTGGRRVFCPYF